MAFTAQGAIVEMTPWAVEALTSALRCCGATQVHALLGTTRARAAGRVQRGARGLHSQTTPTSSLRRSSLLFTGDRYRSTSNSVLAAAPVRLAGDPGAENSVLESAGLRG